MRWHQDCIGLHEKRKAFAIVIFYSILLVLASCLNSSVKSGGELHTQVCISDQYQYACYVLAWSFQSHLHISLRFDLISFSSTRPTYVCSVRGERFPCPCAFTHFLSFHLHLLQSTHFVMFTLLSASSTSLLCELQRLILILMPWLNGAEFPHILQTKIGTGTVRKNEDWRFPVSKKSWSEKK